MPSLIVTSGALAGQVFSFGEMAVVGRGQFTEVRLNHPTVSRRHALLRETPEGFELTDQDSANGTRHRGQRITAPVRIADGDEIEFGEVKTLFRGERAENVSSPGLSLDEHNTGVRETIDPQRFAAALGSETPGLRDLLARLKLFCDLGMIARREAALREQLGQALDALLAAFPRAQRAAVYRSDSASEVLATVAERARANAPTPFAQADAFLREALRLQNGINIVEPVSRAALDAFCALLGEFAGNFALAFDAQGGLFIGGGIAPHLREYLPRSQFRSRFNAKGRMTRFLEAIPAYLILHEDPAFIGLQSLAMRRPWNS